MAKVRKQRKARKLGEEASIVPPLVTMPKVRTKRKARKLKQQAAPLFAMPKVRKKRARKLEQEATLVAPLVAMPKVRTKKKVRKLEQEAVIVAPLVALPKVRKKRRVRKLEQEAAIVAPCAAFNDAAWRCVRRTVSLEVLASLSMLSRKHNSQACTEALHQIVSTSPQESQVGSSRHARIIRAALPWILSISGRPDATAMRASLLRHLERCVEGGQGGIALALCFLAGADGSSVQNADAWLVQKAKLECGRVVSDECVDASRKRRSPNIRWLKALLNAGADANVSTQSKGAPTPLGILAGSSTTRKNRLLPAMRLLVAYDAWTWSEGVLEALWRVSSESRMHEPCHPWTGEDSEWLDFWKEVADTTLKWSSRYDRRPPWEHKFVPVCLGNMGRDFEVPACVFLHQYLNASGFECWNFNFRWIGAAHYYYLFTSRRRDDMRLQQHLQAVGLH